MIISTTFQVLLIIDIVQFTNLGIPQSSGNEAYRRETESLETAIMANGQKQYNFWFLSFFFFELKKYIPPERFHM